MGSDYPHAYEQDGEGPVRDVGLSPFSISVHAVTNAEFAKFVERTGYVSHAEETGW